MKRMRNTCRILLFMVLLILPIKGSTQDHRFHYLNESLDIPIREFNSICGDYNGFIWASSKMGVLRLTEDTYKLYSLPYASVDVINVRLVYRNNLLLAYTNNGQVFRYDAVQDRFLLLFSMFQELENPYLGVNGILVDDRNRIWIASSSGLFVYEDGQLMADENHTAEIQSIEWYDSDQMWIAQSNKLSIYNSTTGETWDIVLQGLREYFGISKLYYDQHEKRLWIGSISNGIYYLNSEETTPELYKVSSIPGQPVLALEPVNDSTIMAGIDGQGLWAIHNRTGNILSSYKEDENDPASLKGNGVYDIYCDADRRVWICTYSGGVSFFDQESPLIKQYSHQINNSNSLVNNDVNDVLEDEEGKLWFATNNGLSSLNPESGRWNTYYQDTKENAQVFTILCEDESGRIWAGTYSSGVYLLDKRTGRQLAHYTTGKQGSEFISNFVFSIYKDAAGDIWIGGVNGPLICYQNATQSFRPVAFLPVIVMEEYSPGKMLVGSTYGLVEVDKISGAIENLLEGFLIHDILLKDKNIWLCTSGEGLIRFNYENKEVTKYTVDDGLLSNYVNSVVFEGGYLWLGTEAGLCRFDPQTNEVTIISSELPVSNIAFNSNARDQLDNGELIWGTNKGTVQFDPSSIQDVKPEGKIFIEDIFISGTAIRELTTLSINSPLDSLEKLSLSYNQNTVSVELISLGTSSTGSKFSWKLNGLDEFWNTPSGNRTINYANLPGGDFTLSIRMYDNSLSQLIDERAIELHITPPFWNRWWFEAGIVLFILGLIGYLMNEYTRMLRKQHSEQKIRFFSGVAHDLRTSATLINSPVEELKKETRISDSGRYYLNLAIEQTRRLNKVVSQLMDFQSADIGKAKLTLAMCDIVALLQRRIHAFQTLAEGKSIQIDFQSNRDQYLTAIDDEKIENVVDNLISNAIKYSHPKGKIEIELQVNDRRWILTVKDEGIGIRRKSQNKLFREFYRGENAVNAKIVGSGIGLVLAKKYISMHGGKISYSSQDKAGSVFQVSVPQKEVELKRDLMPSGDQGLHGLESTPPPQTDTDNSKKNKKEQKLLIAEDNDELRNFIQTALGVNYVIVGAEDGDTAWQSIINDPPDLLISDIIMPGIDGFELCRLVKSTYDTSHIPVILLTSLSGKAEELHGLGLGADDYLTKPFDMTILDKRIKTLLLNRKLIREKAMKHLSYDENELILGNELNDTFVKNMLEVVQGNISNPDFGKDQFAFEMNVSSSLLYKKSKALIDQSPTEFLKAVRMEHALRLIRERKNNITEISILCGFSSVGYFSTVFKSYYGKSPSEMIES